MTITESKPTRSEVDEDFPSFAQKDVLANALVREVMDESERKIRKSNLLRDLYAEGVTLESLAAFLHKKSANEVYHHFHSRDVRIVDSAPNGYVTRGEASRRLGVGITRLDVMIFNGTITREVLLPDSRSLVKVGD
jgi:hypothetical protein